MHDCKRGIAFFILLVLTSFYTLKAKAWQPKIPVERWQVSYSYGGWGYSGTTLPNESEEAAIQAMLTHLQSQNGCVTVFKGLDPKPAESTPPGATGPIGHPGPWPTIKQKDYLNLCHGWSSNTNWYPSLWAGTDQENGNKTCAMVEFIRSPTCRPDQGYYTYGLDFKRSYSPVCPAGYAYAGSGLCACTAINGSYAHCPSEADAGPLCTEDGNSLDDESNPINVGTRSKYIVETDYIGGGDYPLKVQRYYDSQTKSRLGNFGTTWRSNYDLQRIPIYSLSTHTNYFPRPYGRMSVGIRQSNGTHKVRLPERSSFLDTLTEVKDMSGVHLGFKYNDFKMQHVENYDANGNIFSIRDTAGKEHKFTYGLNGRIETVTDSYNRNLIFRYDNLNRVVEIITPYSLFDSLNNTYTRTLKYEYDANGNIVKFINSHGGVRTYLYENPNLPFALTGIVNELGKRIRTWTYESNGLATSSILGSSTKRFGRRVSFSSVGGTTNVEVYNRLDTLQRSGAYTTDNLSDLRVMKTSSGQPCYNCSTKLGSSVTWKRLSTGVDTNVPDYKTSPNGRQDKYAYSATSTLPTSYTIGSNDASLSQTRNTTWDEATRRPLSTETQYLRTTYTYDDEGAVLTKTEFDKVTNATRVTTYTYEIASNGIKRLKFIYDPKGYRTEYRYSTAKGDLQYIINPLGQTTTIGAGPAGDITSIRGPNGVTTYFGYGSQRKLTSLYTHSSTRILRFSYDIALRLTRVTMPDKSYLNFSYNDVGWVTRVTNNYGDYANFAYDDNGYRKSIQIYNSSGSLFHQQNEIYNAFGQLEQIIGGTNSARKFNLTYDIENNIKEIRDAYNNITYNDFDKLNRLTGNRLPNGGRLSIQYDKENRIASLTDANYLTTRYTYDGFGNVTQIDSPDAGIRNITYDLNGNMTSYTDNANLTTYYEYDKLNRLTKILPPDTKLHTFFIYDEGTLGKGKLTTIRDANGYRALFYNYFGDITHISQTVAGVETRLIFTYDSFGRISRIQYPSTRTVDYTYASTGSRIVSVSTTYGGVTTPLATNITYLPFSSRNGWTFGNNKVLSRTYDSDLNLTNQTTTGIENTNYSYDDNENLAQITNSIDPTQNQTFSYNSMNELISASGAYGSKIYTLDENGNRLPSNLGGPLAPTAAIYDSASRVFNIYSTYEPSKYFEFIDSTIRRLGTVNSWATVGSEKSVTSGKYYWEAKMINLSEVTPTNSKGVMVGVGAISTITNNYFTATKNGFSASGGGGLYYGGWRTAWGSVWHTGDVIGIAFDVDNKTLKYYKNGVLDGTSTVITDTTGVKVGGEGTAFSNMPAWKYFPQAALYYPNDKIEINFGNRNFVYTPPAGYVAFDTSASNFRVMPHITGTTTYDPKTKYTLTGLTAVKKVTQSPGSSIRVEKSITTGRWYWEAEYVRAATTTSGNAVMIGIVEGEGSLAGSFAATLFGYGYHLTGLLFNRSTSISSWPAYAQGDVIGVLFDADKGELFFYKNGLPMKNATGLAYANIPRGTYYPAVRIDYINDTIHLNLGQRPFRYAPSDRSFKPLDPGGDGVKPLTNQLMAEQYSPNGNPTTYRGMQFTYTDFDRLRKVSSGTTTIAQYWYNADGLRTAKRVGSSVTGYIYDLSGKMLTEIDGTGRILKEYAYIDDERIAMMVPPSTTNLINNSTMPLPDATRANSLSSLLTSASYIDAISVYMSASPQTLDPTGIYYYHNDHLGTPRTMTDSSGNVVWKSTSDPFGNNTISIQTVKNNHRLPGQYFDAETGLHQNWLRDYDPVNGRYLQIDPIGLHASLNPYIYVEGNPVTNIDLKGTRAGSQGGIINKIKKSLGHGASAHFHDAAKHKMTGMGDGWSDDYSVGSAFRHCYASCIIAADNGPIISKLLGLGYELVTNSPELISGMTDPLMDMQNNSVGDKAGKKFNPACNGNPEKYCEEECKNSPMLYYESDIPKSNPWYKIRKKAYGF